MTDEQIREVIEIPVCPHHRRLSRQQDIFTKSELAKAVREMIIIDPIFAKETATNEALQTVLKLLEAKE